MSVPPQINNILLVDLRLIGDIVVTSPLIRVLHQNFPQANIDYVVRSFNQSLLAHHPLLRQVFSYDRAKCKRNPRASFEFYRTLRHEKYDIAISTHSIMRATAMAWWSGAPWRGGFRSPRLLTHSFLTHPVPCQPKLHVIDEYLSTLAPLGVTDFTHQGLEVYPDSADIANAEELWQGLNIPDSLPVIGIQHGASLPKKRWTDAGVAAVLEGLFDRGYAPVMFGGPGDVETVTRVLSQVSRPVPMLTGRTTILELAALLRKCTALVTCDSGPMHIAASQGVPCVALFGPTDEQHWGPYGDQHLIVRPSIACEKWPCNTSHDDCPCVATCMTSITPEQVLAAVDQQVERRGSSLHQDYTV
ncbi:MAG: glycosyltransferase family 9 protein [Armatimonadota bacterium]